MANKYISLSIDMGLFGKANAALHKVKNKKTEKSPDWILTAPDNKGEWQIIGAGWTKESKQKPEQKKQELEWNYEGGF